ncbi:APC family permease [Arthrobacter sp. ISL-28]|uniref:APC family permease n=1 Tax=Arthrobacter sp. ISL-28 TaxID=2819108 RepID=UPI001BED0B7C|nr:APC family permease [Arthrobacter sp. ISL-28]MBT2522575.1 APC family permease [Arthrobacter sp. ISL-28]
MSHPSPTHPSLNRRTLGVPALVFMTIAASAPLTVVAGGYPSNFAVTGLLGVPLSFVVLGACLLLFTVGYAAMSARIRNAGAFYAYIAQGLGRTAGVGASFLALTAYNAVQVAIYGLFGFASASFINEKTGADVPWWVTAAGAFVVVAWLGVNKVDFSVRVVAVMVALEFLAVLIFDIASFSVQPEGITAAGLLPGDLFTGGVGIVLAFSIASFMGFESAAIYSEEAKDPKRSIARATYISVAVITIFYAISAWAMVMGVGPSQIVNQSQELGPGVLFSFLARNVGVLMADIAQLLFITSLFAALLSFHNAVARYIFALARENVLPGRLAYVNPRTHAPVAGSVVQSAVALTVVTAFAIGGLTSDMGQLFPVLTLFTWLSNVAALGLVLLMALVSLSVIGYFRQNHHGHTLWTRRIAPGLSAFALGTIFVLVLLNFDVLIGTAGYSVLPWLLPAIALVPGVVGIVFGRYLKRSAPEVYKGIGHGADDEEQTGSTRTAQPSASKP